MPHLIFFFFHIAVSLKHMFKLRICNFLITKELTLKDTA
jgi:hypothetical protein